MTEATGARVPVASILIPTWDAADSLPLAVDSARRQTVADIEIVIVGDGVTPAARAAIEPLPELDERIRFLDLPKAPGRGERNRHRGVLACRSDLVVYLADDDLLLPWHVEEIAAAFASADFVQSLNGFIDAEDRLRLWPTDLGENQWRDWHLRQPPRNRVSITGTAHSRALYTELEQGWVAPPSGSWADLTLWQQFFRRPDLRAATLRRLSTLQFPGLVHARREPEGLAAMYERWHAVVCDPDAAAVIAELQRETEWGELVRLSAAESDRTIALAGAASKLADSQSTLEQAEKANAQLALEVQERRTATSELAASQSALEQAEKANALLALEVQQLRTATSKLAASRSAHKRAEKANAQLALELLELRASTSWRVTAPMRAITSRLRRGQDSQA